MPSEIEYAVKELIVKAPWIRAFDRDCRPKIIDVRSYNGVYFTLIELCSTVYYLPICFSSDISRIPHDRVVKVGKQYTYEAEFSNKYLEALINAPFIEKKFLEPMHCIRSAKFIKALDTEASNMLAIYSDGIKIVLKSYKVFSEPNNDHMFLYYLTQHNFKFIPKVYALFSWKARPIATIMEYIENGCNGAEPFYTGVYERLTGTSRGLRLGLAGYLGHIIGELHKTVISINDPFFRPEIISSKDIKLWMESAKVMYGRAMNILSKRVQEDLKDLEWWYNLLDKLYDRAIDTLSQLLDKYYTNLVKIRTHNDLHLLQFIYDGKRFLITDFEGEPGRGAEERVLKYPALRDLACMIRSFHYLTVVALSRHSRRPIHEISLRIFRDGDPLKDWRILHIRSMVASYITNTTIQIHKIMGINASRILSGLKDYIKPWIIERCIYEVYYETLYSTPYITVPILGLHNALGNQY